MGIAFLLLLTVGEGDAPPQMRYADGGGAEFFVRPRAGVWGCDGFEYEAIRTDGTFVHVNETTLYSGGLDLGVEIADHFFVFAGYDIALTDSVTADAVGVAVGYRDRAAPGASPGIPDEVAIYAGGFWSRFEVRETGFGDFDDAIGFRAGIMFTWMASRDVAVSLIGEYRLAEYEYQEPITTEDKEAGGSGGWAGLGVEFRL